LLIREHLLLGCRESCLHPLVPRAASPYMAEDRSLPIPLDPAISSLTPLVCRLGHDVAAEDVYIDCGCSQVVQGCAGPPSSTS
jgi:hypothetical protein